MASSTEPLSFPQISEHFPSLKRTTCDLCRERKVRCDRAKPECGRCKRTGHTCTYPSPSGEAAKINSALQNLHSRLIQAESKLMEQGIPVPSSSSSGSESAISLSRSSPPREVMDAALNDMEAWDQPMFFDGVTDVFMDNAAHMDQVLSTVDQVPSSVTSDPFGMQLPPAMWNMSLTTDSSDLSPGTFVSPTTQEAANPISPAMINCLVQVHFEVIQRHLCLVDRNRFHQEVMMSKTHQHQALKYAVAMSGAASSDEFRSMAQQLYLTTRNHIGLAEVDSDPSCFMSLETIQALVLVARYEFMRKRPEIALITMARLMRLTSLMGYDQLSQQEQNVRPSIRAQEVNTAKLQEKRRAYLLAYSMHCHASSTAVGYAAAIDIDGNSSIASSAASTVSLISERGPSNTVLTNSVLHPIADDHGPLSLLVLAMKLVTATDRHHSLTTANVAGTGAKDYNFCLGHEHVEVMINSILSSVSSDMLHAGTNNELYVLSLMITLGARIALYNTAVIECQKAKFLGPVVGESRKMGISAANAMIDILLQSGVMDPNKRQIWSQTSLFISRPLSLAAEILLCAQLSDVGTSGGSTVQNNDLGMNHNMYYNYTNRDMRQSLEIVFTALEAFKGDTDTYDTTLKDCRDYLVERGSISRASDVYGPFGSVSQTSHPISQLSSSAPTSKTPSRPHLLSSGTSQMNMSVHGEDVAT